MTFDEIVDMVAKDLNLTAAVSIERIGTHVNRRYRQVARRLGMNVYSRVEVDFDCAAGSNEQEVLDDNDPPVQRIVSIFLPSSDPNGRSRALDQITYDEMMTLVPSTGIDPPRRWAPKRMGSQNIVFLLDSTVDNGLTLILECEEVKSTLAGDDVPDFLEAFHEMLVKGAKADELNKMEKPTLAKVFKEEFKDDLDELALKTVLGAHQDIFQGKTARQSKRGTLARH